MRGVPIAVVLTAAGLLVSTTTGCAESRRRSDPDPRDVYADPSATKHGEWFIQPDWNDRISGRFVFDDGRPGAGVGYSLVWIDAPPESASWWNPRTTDASGRFSVGRLPAGTFEIEVYPPWENGQPDVAAAIVGPFHSGDDGVIITVRPGRRLLGRVVTSDGNGVPRAEIEIGPRPRSGPVTVRVSSADDGSFAALHAPHGPVYLHVDARDVGDGGRERLVVDLGPIDPKDGPLDVVMDRGLAIGGRLTLPDGSPKSGVCIVAVPPGAEAPLRDDAPWNGCRTDADGRFVVRGLAPGVYEVWAWPWISNPWRGMSMFRQCFGERSAKPLDGEGGTRAGTIDLKLTWTERPGR